MGLFSRVKGAFSGSDKEDVWQSVADPANVEAIVEASKKRPQLIYKHSHRCSVCFVARRNLEGSSDEILKKADMHYVNVVKSRDTSNKIASELDVHHESPQAILIDNAEVVWHASHGRIDADVILENLG